MKKILLIILTLVILAAGAAAYFFLFTSSGYRMTVPYNRSFEKIADNVYVNKGYAGDTNEIIKLTDRAKERTTIFFGSLRCTDETIFIICDDKDLISKLGGDHDTITAMFPAKKNLISISAEYLDLDIFAHELTHAELHSRLSDKALTSIPTWFDEGLATQNDYREKYSEENWFKQTENGKITISPENMDTPDEFYEGTNDEKAIRYLNAKHMVSEWMTTHGMHGLLDLIDKLNSGEDFSTAYGK